MMVFVDPFIRLYFFGGETWRHLGGGTWRMGSHGLGYMVNKHGLEVIVLVP